MDGAVGACRAESLNDVRNVYERSFTNVDYCVSDAGAARTKCHTWQERRKYECHRRVPSGRSLMPDDIFTIATYADCRDRNREGEILARVNLYSYIDGARKILYENIAFQICLYYTRKIDGPDTFSSRTHQDAIFLGLITSFVHDQNCLLLFYNLRGHLFGIRNFALTDFSCKL